MEGNKEEEFIHYSVGELISLLKEYPKDMIITDEENRNFIHIVNRQGNCITLSTQKPIGHCPHCGDYVYKTIVEDYTGVCPTCDENMYGFEITELDNNKDE